MALVRWEEDNKRNWFNLKIFWWWKKLFLLTNQHILASP